MMHLEKIGTYLDRRITFQGVGSLTELVTTELSEAVLLVWLSDRSWRNEDLISTIKSLSNRNPLGISVAGERSNESFSTLLEVLSILPSTTEHIMTGVFPTSDMSEGVLEFLGSTYPDETRFEEWQEYRVIVVGDEDDQQRMAYSIKNALRRI